MTDHEQPFLTIPIQVRLAKDNLSLCKGPVTLYGSVNNFWRQKKLKLTCEARDHEVVLDFLH